MSDSGAGSPGGYPQGRKAGSPGAAIMQEVGASYSFAGKRAVVTGAGKGIGRAIAMALHQSGCFVAAISRTDQDLRELEDALGYDHLVTAQADLQDPSAIQAAMEKVLSKMGGVDFLVNNAGVAKLGPLLDVSPDDFDTTMAVNMKACLICTQISAKRMIADGVKGSIVNVSSQASMTALPDHTSYCVSKAGLDMLTKMTALELGPHGIRCNAVNPTVVMTDMGRKAWGEETKAAPMLNRIPLKRFAEVSEVVGPVMFLLSPGSGMVNGSVVPIEGGLLSCCTLR